MLIDDMRDALASHGWTKGTFQNANNGRMCLLGVYYRTTDLTFMWNWSRRAENEATLKVLAQIVREQYPERTWADRSGSPADYRDVVVAFNDHRDTTLNDIRAVLDKAQVRLEEEVA